MKKFFTIFTITLLFSIQTFAQAEKYKALFVYNFTKHIEWPQNLKSGDFVIGVIGQKQLTDKLIEVTNGKKVGAQNIVIQTFASVDEISGCHILILGTGNSTPKRLTNAITKAGKNTLIVTNGANMATKGATINFAIFEGKLKFELNKANASTRQLKISSYLENLAIIVG